MNVPNRYNESRQEKIFANFKGLDRRNKSGVSYFRDMKNMSGDEYKSITSRPLRGKVNVEAEYVKSMVNTDVYIGGKIIEDAFLVDTGEKLRAYYFEEDKAKVKLLMSTSNFTVSDNQMIASGGYLYLFPDNKYINLMNTEDRGSLSAVANLKTGKQTENSTDFFYEAVFKRCDKDGTENASGSYMFITRKKYEYKNSQKGAELGPPAITQNFEVGDVVKVSGSGKDTVDGFHKIVSISIDGRSMIVDGGDTVTVSSGNLVTVSRDIPEMDYVVACGNRLWGCRYGVGENGLPVNEIYASALGDAKNWYKYDGVSTDSFAASIGVDGVFTGAIEYMGTPVFFKEDAVIRIYGDYPSNYNVYVNSIRGVEKGSSKSAVVVNDMLYYKTHSGIVCYNGGCPLNIDESLGSVVYKNAVAGVLQGKYYISLERDTGETELLVYDTVRREWYKEDSLKVIDFVRSGRNLYMLTQDRSIYSVICGENSDIEEDFEWSCETSDFLSTSMGRKIISSVDARMEAGDNTEVTVEIDYDRNGKWKKIATARSRGRIVSLRLRPKRCDSFRLRFSGKGEFCLVSMAVTRILCGRFRGIVK